jgi:small-conductance mechanosensitive channel
MSDQTTRAIVTGVAWLAAIIVLRAVLNAAFARYERRLGEKDSFEAARWRTTYSLLVKVIIAIVVTIGVWNVLSIFPATNNIAKAMLASSAVIALFAGLAFSTPLANLGSGLLVAFSQPLRLGDRVTIAEHTGFVESITLIYTTLVTDDARRIFIPNTQLTQAPIVNRTIRDPRRAAGVRLPIGIDAPIAEARAALLAAVAPFEDAAHEPTKVLIDEVTENVVWLEVTVYAALDADVSRLGSQVREAGLEALRERGYLRS